MSGQEPMAGPALLRSLGSASSAFSELDGVTGLLDGYLNGAALELRTDLAQIIRRLTNLALVAGAKPGDVEASKESRNT